MTGDDWVKIITAVFAGLASLLSAWAVVQNKGLRQGQQEHEKRAQARSKKLIGEVEEECDETG